MSLTIFPLRGLAEFPPMEGYFKFFSWLIILATRPGPAWQKMAQFPLYGTTQSVNIEEKGWSQIMDGWKTMIHSITCRVLFLVFHVGYQGRSLIEDSVSNCENLVSNPGHGLLTLTKDENRPHYEVECWYWPARGFIYMQSRSGSEKTSISNSVAPL